jgi:hypothetical protein
MAPKVTGPASYFLSIEKKYGKPITHLKTKFEMGHGHAKAIVAVFRKENDL